MYHKDVVVVVNCHDDCGVPPGVPETCVGMKFHPVPRAHEQARKGLLDGAVDLPSFNAGMVDPTYSSQDVLVNLTLQLIRKES